MENYPGIKQISGNEWASGLVEQILDLGVRTELETVTGIRPDGPRWIVETMEGIHIGRALILATGVSHRRLGLPREEDLMGAGLSTCAVCDGAFYAGEDTAVVGGGDTALQRPFSSPPYAAGYCDPPARRIPGRASSAGGPTPAGQCGVAASQHRFRAGRDGLPDPA